MRGRATPLRQAYAHNDEEQARPLHDALDHGFTAVEADVWAVGDQLLIGHDEPHPTRTLQQLYLDPLAALVAANGGPVDGRFELFVDVKTEAYASYQLLDTLLAKYGWMLTQWRHGSARERSVTVVVSGNRAPSAMASQSERYACCDGRLADLDSGLDPALMPVISDDWPRHFGWRGVGPMASCERARLRAYVATAHERGYRVRFWGMPDAPGPARHAVWRTQLAAGVDYVSTDDLAGLRAFLTTA